MLPKLRNIDLSFSILRGTIGSFLIKVTGALLTFLVGIALARILKAEGYGIYSYVMAWVMVLTVPGKLGSDHLLVREVSILFNKKDNGLFKGILPWITRWVSFASICIASLACMVAWLCLRESQLSKLHAFWAAMTLLPFYCLIGVHQAALRGLNRIVTGQVPEIILRPIFFIIFVGFSYFSFGLKITPTHAVIMNIGSAAIVLVVCNFLLQKSIPYEVMLANPVYDKQTWLRKTLPFMLIGGMQVINSNTDTIMLGVMANNEAVGIYRVANRGAWLMTFVLMAVNTTLAPIIAKLYSINSLQKLRRIVSFVACFTFLSSMLLWVLFILWGHDLLNLFGAEFVAGYTALITLSTGLLICTIAASAGLLLMMTGYEKDAAWAIGISAVINLILNGTLIPMFSYNGAAFSTAISTIFMNLALIMLVVKRTGINPTIFGMFYKGKMYEK